MKGECTLSSNKPTGVACYALLFHYKTLFFFCVFVCLFGSFLNLISGFLFIPLCLSEQWDAAFSDTCGLSRHTLEVSGKGKESCSQHVLFACSALFVFVFGSCLLRGCCSVGGYAHACSDVSFARLSSFCCGALRKRFKYFLTQVTQESKTERNGVYRDMF